MKAFLLALFFSVGATAVHADTIDLFTTGGFGNLHQYHNVDTSLCTTSPCETSAQVTIYISTLASVLNPPPQRMQLWFGADLAGSFFGPYYGSGIPTTLTGVNGQLTVTLNETSRVVKGSGSGRGGYASHTVWTLQSGVIVR